MLDRSDSASCAVLMVLPPGVFITMMPFLLCMDYCEGRVGWGKYSGVGGRESNTMGLSEER
jgi:hypothetical protein